MSKQWTVKFNSVKVLAVLAAGGLATQLANGQCVPPPVGLIAWWPGNGNALDMVGTHNGTLKTGVTYAPGKSGQAFTFDGSGAGVDLGWAFDLQQFSISFWVKPASDQADYANMIDNNHGSSQNWAIETVAGGTTNGWHWGNGKGESGCVYFSLTNNVWHHVTVTQGSNTVSQVYLNGQLVGTAPSPGPIVYIDPHFWLGSWGGGSRAFKGQIDEVAVFGRELSATEIQAVYQADSASLCLLGITTPPRSQLGYWGNSLSFSVAAWGQGSLSYQWQKEGTPIANATNATLILTNLQLTDAGSYTVVVTDQSGSITSDPAVLTMNPSGVSIALYAGVTIDGVVGQTYGVQSTLDLSNTNSWLGRANVTLTNATQLWYDSQPATHPQTYYRVVPGPISVP